MSTIHESKLNLEWLTKTVREKCPETRSKKLISVVSEPIIGDGSHFTSDVDKIDLIFIDETDNGKFAISLVSKISKPIKAQAEADLWTNRVEVEIYVNVLAEMEKLMIEYNDNRVTPWPKLYGHSSYSIILLEDVTHGVISIPRTVSLNEDFSILALKTLARYHAMSKILLTRGLIGEQYRNEYVLAKKTIFQEKLYNAMLHLLSTAMIEKEGHWKSVESSEEWGERLRLLMPTVCDRREEIYLNYDERFTVLNHGDFRKSNILFKTTENTDHPIEVRVVDYQLPHVNSFCWDIATFMALNCERQWRREHRIQLLEAYHQSFAENLTFFDFEGYIPTIEDVKNEVDRAALIEFMSSVCTSPCLKEQNALALDKIVSHPPEEAINKSIYSEKTYVEEVIGDFEQAIHFKLI